MKSLRAGLLLLGLLSAGCQEGLLQQRARLEDEGGLYVYLEPLDQEADRLHVVVAGISVLRPDGTELPLSVSLHEWRARDVRRQRLLAAGPLPLGDYSGLVVRPTAASLGGEQGESALLLPEASTRIDFGFTVRRRESRVIALRLRSGESLEGGGRFRPVFAVYTPERPAVALMGFVANRRSADITVFDKKARRVFDVVATGRGPTGLALDQRARRLYVALSEDDAVDVLDILSGHMIDRIRLTPGDEPVELALTPDGLTLLSANRGSNTVSVIDPLSRFEVTKIPVGNGPRSITLDRLGHRAFVASPPANAITVIDLPSRSVVRSISTDPMPVRGQLNRRGDRLYVVHETVPYVTAVNPLTLTVAGRFPLRAPAEAITVDPSTDFVYLAGRRDFAVGVYDPLSFAPVDYLDTGGPIVDMTTDTDENALYLVSPDTNRLLVSDRIRRRVVGEVDVGDGPVWVDVMGEN